jgi:hypothetical protein
MTVTDTQRLLESLMRTIDRKTVLTVEAGTDASTDKISVRLSQGKRNGSLQVSGDDILAAESDLIRRNRLRAALKRTHDKMWHDEGTFFSTKMPEHKADAGGDWGRGGGGPRRGGGRR